VQVAGKDAISAGAVLERAVAGDLDAVGAYVDSYKCVAGTYLSTIGEWSPDLMYKEGDRFLIVDVHGHPSEDPWEVIELAAAQAPFSRWVASWGIVDGMAAYVLDCVRQAIPHLKPLSPPLDVAIDVFHKGSPTRFAQLVTAQLRGERGPVDRVREIFDLNKTEMGELFGVSGEAVRGWAQHVPNARRSKLLTVMAIGNLLEQKLQSGTVPAVARAHASAYGGATMLELIRDDRHEELLVRTRESFDWSVTA
jgi:hypothetical protein